MHIGFVGAGNMAQAIIGGLLNTGTSADEISIYEPSQALAERLVASQGIRAAVSNVELFEQCDVIVLAVKPQVMKSALESVRGARLKENAFVLSIAAGIPIASIQDWLGADHPVVRVMPNTPVLVGAGVSGLYASDQTRNDQREAAESILRAVGSVVWLESEALIDSVAAGSGCGPASFFYFIEALEQAALENGLSAEQARLLSLETAFGASKLALESSVSAAELRTRVTSPGGMTEAALKVFDAQALSDTVKAAVRASVLRGRELAETTD